MVQIPKTASSAPVLMGQPSLILPLLFARPNLEFIRKARSGLSVEIPISLGDLGKEEERHQQSQYARIDPRFYVKTPFIEGGGTKIHSPSRDRSSRPGPHPS